MRPFDGRRVLLGITGGIASYKSVLLARLLSQAGAEVDVVMTRAAQEFVGAITFEAVTGRRSYSEIFGSGNTLDHIRLARESEVFVVAPATADFLARAAHGHADDLLTACLLANVSPVLLVPAMNDRMWANAQTVRNVSHLRETGITVIEPDEGPLAAGEGAGPGRMPEPEAIFAEIARILEPRGALAGLDVIVTAGATREPVDPVRFISNHSSGRMGVALAEAAYRRGANVTLIAGHLDVEVASWLRVIHSDTTRDMLDAVAESLPHSDVLIMAGAPADFRPRVEAAHKLKKSSDDSSTIQLVQTEDILKSTIGIRRTGAIVVGFALETENDLANGVTKLREKHLDVIVVNNAVEEGAGFGSVTNRVTLLSPGQPNEQLPMMQKTELADVILDRVAAILNGR
ncbi:MAG: bifunctional phosphopantothenoylcysteine decarboxylase/phosphopantothenate--cysteine ligase CoaBC [Gemmatimonadota bacterium]|nr:bifunctional phosphopantothenoylcysteine decarboxylase/phosphopantothenate--cysteine ligase CoaBC [Gemmatimonadota bacterium]